ncbi:hypothetical protein UCRPC4_g02440 [Phaeomoniella chlamydospora]|uniref:Uncharacterized protein n=1 Tax=Phaeomoniella chlamydospora TaxID=158046 RepID=A0A0G2ENY2_PHACM|nr:hypothetical protein UCRPC4_g02440 [Phaeomoniella chlamydospora]
MATQSGSIELDSDIISDDQRTTMPQPQDPRSEIQEQIPLTESSISRFSTLEAAKLETSQTQHETEPSDGGFDQSGSSQTTEPMTPHQIELSTTPTASVTYVSDEHNIRKSRREKTTVKSQNDTEIRDSEKADFIRKLGEMQAIINSLNDDNIELRRLCKDKDAQLDFQDNSVTELCGVRDGMTLKVEQLGSALTTANRRAGKLQKDKEELLERINDQNRELENKTKSYWNLQETIQELEENIKTLQKFMKELEDYVQQLDAKSEADEAQLKTKAAIIEGSVELENDVLRADNFRLRAELFDANNGINAASKEQETLSMELNSNINQNVEVENQEQDFAADVKEGPTLDNDLSSKFGDDSWSDTDSSVRLDNHDSGIVSMFENKYMPNFDISEPTSAGPEATVPLGTMVDANTQTNTDDEDGATKLGKAPISSTPYFFDPLPAVKRSTISKVESTINLEPAKAAEMIQDIKYNDAANQTTPLPSVSHNAGIQTDYFPSDHVCAFINIMWAIALVIVTVSYKQGVLSERHMWMTANASTRVMLHGNQAIPGLEKLAFCLENWLELDRMVLG